MDTDLAHEKIVARRVTEDEYLDYVSKVEYIDGRMITRSGVKLFVGVREFEEAIRALEEEQATSPQPRGGSLKNRWH